MNKSTVRISLVAWIIFVIAIILGSILPQVHTPENYHLDKFIHAGAYALIAFLACFFITNHKILIITLFLLILMGGGIEILQCFIPQRSGTVGDFSADVVGIFVGLLLASKLKPSLIKWFKL